MYLILKSLHIVAVAIFLGNIVTGLFWKAHADRTGDRRIIAHTMLGIIRSDRWFTIPGVVVITAAGVGAAVEARIHLLRTGWVLWSIVAFALSGIAFAWKIMPLQKELHRMTAGEGEPDWSSYRSKSLEWEIWGLFATLLPFVAVALMTMKPRL